MKLRFLIILFHLLFLSHVGFGQNSFKVIHILIELEKDFKQVRKKFDNRPDLETFTNSLDKTLGMIQEYQDSYHNWGVAVPLETIITSEIKADTNGKSIFSSSKYWNELKVGLLNYGSIESRNIEANHVTLLCKKNLENHYPGKLVLINDGEFKGFFVDAKGDIFVPGIKFYKDLLNRRIAQENFNTIHFYFKSYFPAALQDIENGRFDDAIHKINEMIKHNSFDDILLADLYFNRGYAYSMLSHYSLAHEDYNRSIELCLKKNINLSDIFTRRGYLHHRMGLMDNAVKDFREAYKYETNELKKRWLLQFIENIENNMVRIQ